MKKYLFLVLLLSSINCFAEMKDINNIHSLVMVSDKEIPLSAEYRKEIELKKLQVKNKGYYNTTRIDDYTKFLLGIKKNSVQEIKSYKGTQDKNDTHLKKSAQEIKLAFKFKKLPIDDKNIIAYTPVGSYVSDPEGWNGIKIFFDNHEVGNICAYEFFDLELSHGGVMMSRDGVKYSVNNKPTVTDVEGNPIVGFVYSVVWYNNLKVSRIDCVTKSFDKTVTDKMLKLAKKIDDNDLVVGL